jgi:DNA-binding response OmpR family regulator
MAEGPTRILVVEDEGLVAMLLEEALIELGYSVVGPAGNTKKALSLLATEGADAAVLDVNLGGERVDRVAQALAAASIPFIFTTGYSDVSALPVGFQNRVMLHKPYRINQLQSALVHLLLENPPATILLAGSVRT